MMTLADSTELLQQTTEQLHADGAWLTPAAGITLIDQWLGPLAAAENTRPIADLLQHLKALLQAPQINNETVQQRMGELAQLTTTMGSGMGSEGELPSLMDGLASALRQAGQSARTDG